MLHWPTENQDVGFRGSFRIQEVLCGSAAGRTGYALNRTLIRRFCDFGQPHIRVIEQDYSAKWLLDVVDRHDGRYTLYDLRNEAVLSVRCRHYRRERKDQEREKPHSHFRLVLACT